jgi:histidyl-tRNA synthetase
MDHFFGQVLGLDAEGARKLSKALDAKDKLSPEAYGKWLSEIGLDREAVVKLEEFLQADFDFIKARYPSAGTEEVEALFAQLPQELVGPTVVYDPTIMRGMDYYTGTVFEAYDISPENRRALFGGGRYDNLVGLFAKQKLSGMGFGLGDVSLRDFLETHGKLPSPGGFVDVFVTTPSAASASLAREIAGRLRSRGLRTVLPLGFEGFGAQLKSASKHGARLAILLGEEEIKRDEVGVKDLSTGQQNAVSQAELADYCAKMLGQR